MHAIAHDSLREELPCTSRPMPRALDWAFRFLTDALLSTRPQKCEKRLHLINIRGSVRKNVAASTGAVGRPVSALDLVQDSLCRRLAHGMAGITEDDQRDQTTIPFGDFGPFAAGVGTAVDQPTDG